MKTMSVTAILTGLLGISYANFDFPCNSSNYNPIVYLPLNEITFFKVDFGCNLTFILKSTNKNPRRYLITRFYNNRHNVYPPAAITLSNATSYSTGILNTYLEGSIIFEDNNSKCPLQSISNPFNFTDENQVLYLENNELNLHPCNWKFVAPLGYGFKVVVQVFEANAITNFTVYNSTDILINQNSVKLDHAIYNSDSFISIYFNNTTPNLHFQAYVSVVKKNVENKDGNCTFTFSQGRYYWTLKNLGAPLENNLKCDLDLVITPDIEMTVDITVYNLGDTAGDYIGYYDIDGNLVKYDVGMYQMKNSNGMQLKFDRDKNGTDRNVSWVFVSDGSLPVYEFQVMFETIPCTCSNKTFSCDENDHDISDSMFYCSDMDCEFYIENCENSNFTRLDIYIARSPQIISQDSITVFSNETLVYQTFYSNIQTDDHPVILNSENMNYFRLTSFHSDYGQILSVKVSGYESKFLNSFFKLTSRFHASEPDISLSITLTHDNPSFAIDSYFYNFISVEISEDFKASNYAFEMLRIYAGYIFLYTDETLTQQLNASFCTDNKENYGFFKCIFTGHKNFVIYSAAYGDILGTEYQFAAIHVLNTTKKCLYDNIVYHQTTHFDSTQVIPHYPDDLIISTVSSLEHPCLLTFLLDSTKADSHINSITHLWTTSRHENVKVFGGFDQNMTLFEFNSRTQYYWKDIRLNSQIYSLEIPRNSSIFMIVSGIPRDTSNALADITSEISEFPYYSVATTSCFKHTKLSTFFNFTQIYEIGDYDVKFTALYLYLPNMPPLSLYANSTSYSFTKPGDFYIFRNQDVSLQYYSREYYESSDINIGALIYIESFNGTVI